MTRIRYVSFVLVVVAALLATGTGAFASTSAERANSVNVAPDERAFLEIDADEIELRNGRSGNSSNRSGGSSPTEVRLLTIRNHFASEVETLTVTPTDGATAGTPPKIVDDTLETAEIRPDEYAVTADVVCSGAAAEGTLRLLIEARGDSFGVSTSETVTVACVGSGG
jgi:hypothetical protein